MNGNHGLMDKINGKTVYKAILAGLCLVLLSAGAGIVLRNGRKADQNTEAGYIYESWGDFKDNYDLPYADEETVAVLREAYGEIRFEGVFERGKPECHDEYKANFLKLLDNEITFTDGKTGDKAYLKDFEGLCLLGEAPYDKYQYKYCFFDMDEDGAPELGIKNPLDYSIQYIFRYDRDREECFLWHTTQSQSSLCGSRRVAWRWERKAAVDMFELLDADGKAELTTQGMHNWNDEGAELYIVMLPDYREEEKKKEVTGLMKRQGIYERSAGRWFFRVTEEQYEELMNPFWEAFGLAEKERGEVTYSYEELFGEMAASALAVPTVPDPACFTYEELEDGALRITGYDEGKNKGNPYRVIIPSELGGRPVSTLGTRSIHANDLIELVISEGITTLEKEVFASGWEPCLVALPDSVIHIDEDAFYPVIISCDSEAAYAYEYAMEHGLACRVVNPAAEENAFLQDYAVSRHARLPYLCHIRQEGEIHDYIVIEYLDIAGQLRDCLDSDSRFFPSDIWDYNEFAVLVLDRESGAVLQCIDSASFHGYPETVSLDYLPYVHCQDILSVADWNFDGFPDLSLYQGTHGTGAVSFEAVFLFDRDSGTYVHADDFPSRNICLRTDKQCIESSERGSAVEHYVCRYQYVDGVMTHVAALSLYELWEDGAVSVGVRDERLIDGEWQVYREEKVILEDNASSDDVFAAHDRLAYLYADDGYWDLWE